MGSSKFNLAIAQNIAAKNQKIKQTQNKSSYKYFQNTKMLLNNQKSDLFVKKEQTASNIYRKSITEEIADRILSNIQKGNK